MRQFSIAARPPKMPVRRLGDTRPVIWRIVCNTHVCNIVLQVDLEPNGKIHIMVQLIGTASEGETCIVYIYYGRFTV